VLRCRREPPGPFDDVTQADIESLVAVGRPERRTMEYKEALPKLGLEQDKVEFLADISSFANSSGGDILYGVAEKRSDGKATGIPESAPGVNVSNLDAVLLQLQQAARANISPRLPGLYLRPIPGFPAGPVVLVRVPRSYVAPHMVENGKNWGRFYARASNGKYIMDVGEVRSAFSLSDTLTQRLREFRAARVAAIHAGETPCSIRPGPKVILHILPLQALDPLVRPALSLDLRRIRVIPMFSSHADHRYNFDGSLNWAWDQHPADVQSYTQLFRTGAVEAVDARALSSDRPPAQLIPSGLEQAVIQTLDRCKHHLKEAGVPLPLVVMLILLGVKGYRIQRHYDSKHPVDRDILFLPDALVEDYAEESAISLRPAFDAMWQAAGWERCLLYDAQGQWITR
jgi:hypothetical protein